MVELEGKAVPFISNFAFAFRHSLSSQSRPDKPKATQLTFLRRFIRQNRLYTALVRNSLGARQKMLERQFQLFSRKGNQSSGYEAEVRFETFERFGSALHQRRREGWYCVCEEPMPKKGRRLSRYHELASSPRRSPKMCPQVNRIPRSDTADC